jgi:hypothetical protein
MTERRRRPHAAQGARILTAGLSAAAVLSITAGLAFAQRPAAAPTVTGGPTAVSATPSPFVTTAPPDATTHGSR